MTRLLWGKIKHEWLCLIQETFSETSGKSDKYIFSFLNYLPNSSFLLRNWARKSKCITNNIKRFFKGHHFESFELQDETNNIIV